MRAGEHKLAAAAVDSAAAAAAPHAREGDGGFHWSDLPALCVFVVLFGTVGLQFFTRYVLNDSLGWTEEIARYLLILLGFFGGVCCCRRHSHIHLEFLHHRLPPAPLRWLLLFCRALSAAFFVVCAVLCVQLAAKTASSMASLPLPKDLIYYLAGAGCAAMAGWTLRDAAALWRKTPAQAASDVAAAKTAGL